MGRARIHDVTAGQVFGRWTVVEQIASVNGRPSALCVCSCGTQRVVVIGNLARGFTLSCGCLRRQRHDEGRVSRPQAARAAADRRRTDGLCTACGNSFEPSAMKNGRLHVQCAGCRSKKNSYALEWRNRRLDEAKAYRRELGRRRRQMVYDRYGGKCACCSETEFVFLSIDHIDGGGTQHRVRGGSSPMVTRLSSVCCAITATRRTAFTATARTRRRSSR
jgi:hypothetical protein